MSSFNRKSAVFTQGGGTRTRTPRGLDNYQVLDTAVRRHQFTASAPQLGTPAALLPNEYFITRLLKFKRTFGAGADDPPSPTASNNYQSSTVFNGSKVGNMDAVVRLKNNGTAQEATLDIYEIALSFFDALIWNSVRPTNCPFTFTTAGVTSGELVEKAIVATTILDSDWNNFKFQQRYLRKVGTVTIPNTDGDNVVEFRVNQIPPKCRRSQTGMYYGYIFANDSNKNAAATLALDYSLEEKFDEFPAENRLPYID